MARHWRCTRRCTAALLAERRAWCGTDPHEAVDARVELDVESDADVPDPLERFARTGFDALERFGAEIEAAIVGRFGDGGHSRGEGGTGGRPTTPESAPRASRLRPPSPTPSHRRSPTRRTRRARGGRRVRRGRADWRNWT